MGGNKNYHEEHREEDQDATRHVKQWKLRGLVEDFGTGAQRRVGRSRSDSVPSDIDQWHVSLAIDARESACSPMHGTRVHIPLL